MKNNIKLQISPFYFTMYCFLLLFCFVLSSCQYDPHAHLFTTSEPKNEEIVGTYILDKYYLPDSITIKDKSIKLKIHSDGTFTAINIPSWKLEEPESNFASTLISGKGNWQKSTLGVVGPGSKNIWGLYLRTSDNRFHPASFIGDEFPYGLIFTLGDPDSGNAIILRRQGDK